MNMEAFVLGCGGMMPLPYRHLTSVLLRRDGDLFLFDGGEGTQVSLRRLNLKWKKIDAIFVSHTHADHVTGLPGILMLSAQVERTEPLYIYGPPKIKEYMSAPDADTQLFYETPFLETQAMISETTSLVYEKKDTTGVIVVHEQGKNRKDRYTSVSYGSYMASMLERDLVSRNEDYKYLCLVN